VQSRASASGASPQPSLFFLFQSLEEQWRWRRVLLLVHGADVAWLPARPSWRRNWRRLERGSGIRAREEDTFKASEKELMGSIDMLGKAIDILEKEMAKTGSASLLQNSETTQNRLEAELAKRQG